MAQATRVSTKPLTRKEVIDQERESYTQSIIRRALAQRPQLTQSTGGINFSREVYSAVYEEVAGTQESTLVALNPISGKDTHAPILFAYKYPPRGEGDRLHYSTVPPATYTQVAFAMYSDKAILLFTTAPPPATEEKIWYINAKVKRAAERELGRCVDRHTYPTQRVEKKLALTFAGIDLRVQRTTGGELHTGAKGIPWHIVKTNKPGEEASYSLVTQEIAESYPLRYVTNTRTEYVQDSEGNVIEASNPGDTDPVLSCILAGDSYNRLVQKIEKYPCKGMSKEVAILFRKELISALLIMQGLLPTPERSGEDTPPPEYQRWRRAHRVLQDMIQEFFDDDLLAWPPEKGAERKSKGYKMVPRHYTCKRAGCNKAGRGIKGYCSPICYKLATRHLLLPWHDLDDPEPLYWQEGREEKLTRMQASSRTKSKTGYHLPKSVLAGEGLPKRCVAMPVKGYHVNDGRLTGTPPAQQPARTYTEQGWQSNR